ncbi:hypothetical protein DFJ63DRAFT_335296 [Scheffersomyces coipomensis]|uniref:uncharacterized protein n=1 Tax=Scheffersomyces coipomensis TaxID=1788519 RepID=UPI00315CF6F7
MDSDPTVMEQALMPLIEESELNTLRFALNFHRMDFFDIAFILKQLRSDQILEILLGCKPLAPYTQDLIHQVFKSKISFGFVTSEIFHPVYNRIDHIENAARLLSIPDIKFKDLEILISSEYYEDFNQFMISYFDTLNSKKLSSSVKSIIFDNDPYFVLSTKFNSYQNIRTLTIRNRIYSFDLFHNMLQKTSNPTTLEIINVGLKALNVDKLPRNLLRLDLSQNPLTHFTFDINEVESQNLIRTSWPPRLRYLNLKDCLFVQHTPIRTLPNKNLNVSHNKNISLTINDQIFSPSTSLKFEKLRMIDINSNRISSIDNLISLPPNLIKVDLSKNCLTADSFNITERILHHKSLKRFDLSYNLIDLDDLTFQGVEIDSGLSKFFNISQVEEYLED